MCSNTALPLNNLLGIKSNTAEALVIPFGLALLSSKNAITSLALISPSL
jgi:hypothetical protein